MKSLLLLLALSPLAWAKNPILTGADPHAAFFDGTAVRMPNGSIQPVAVMFACTRCLPPHRYRRLR